MLFFLGFIVLPLFAGVLAGSQVYIVEREAVALTHDAMARASALEAQS